MDKDKNWPAEKGTTTNKNNSFKDGKYPAALNVDVNISGT